MKRLLAVILALACILSFAGCDRDNGTDDPKTDGNNNGPGVSQGIITPGGDNVVNEDGNLNIPMPEEGTAGKVDSGMWQELLAEDAIRSYMKDNSITTMTSSANPDEYQMYFCAGGRYGSILNGNYRSETVYTIENGTAYVYKKFSTDAGWTRTTSPQSYDEYVTSAYINGAMQFLSGLASVQGKAVYVEAEEAYVIENHVIAISADDSLTGTVQIRFANEKLYSISFSINVEGQTATLRTLFGSVATPEVPTEFTDGGSGNSTSSNVSPDHGGHHGEPKEAVCSESQWQRLFGERLVDNLMDHRMTIQITNGQDEYLYQLDGNFSRFVISANGGYEEILISRSEYYLRSSKDGQWTRYRILREYDTILDEKTAVLTQLLAPLKDLYQQAAFSGGSEFSLGEIEISHGTFGSMNGQYTIDIHGGRLEQIQASFRSARGQWTLSAEEDKSNGIDLPTDYIDTENKGADHRK